MPYGSFERAPCRTLSHFTSAPRSVDLNEMPPATTGTLADKPLVHLIVYSLEKQLTGTLELLTPRNEQATIVMSRGQIAKVRTSAKVAYLGAVLYELGFIQDTELNASLLELAKQKRPHGQILLGRGSITSSRLSEGLREQTLRKLAHLFSFGPSTTFTFLPEQDLLPAYGGNEPVLTDPSPAIWRGIREHPSASHVRLAMDRIGNAPCRLVSGGRLDRFQLHAEVLATAERLKGRAITVKELQASQLMSPKTTELLLYCLLITKELEIIDAATPPARAPLAQLDAMRASVSKMRAVTPTSPEFFPGRTPSRPDIPIPRTDDPISFNIRAASPVPARTASSPSNAPVSTRTPSSASNAPASARTPSSPSNAPASTRTPSTPSSPGIAAQHAGREQAIHERAKGITKENFYQRLSLPRDASQQAVEDAYRALARVWNPSDLPPALEGARESCAFVRSMLTEAHITLSDPRKRHDYSQNLFLGPKLPDAASDLAASGEKTDYEGAKACLARNDLDRAERMAKRAHKAKPEDAPTLALLAWVAAQQPSNQGIDATRARILMLDKALKIAPNCVEALTYRWQLHRRVDNHSAAMRDLQILTEINSSDVEAQRELRVYEMRVRRNSLSMQAVRSASPLGTAKPTPSGLFDRLRKKT